MRAPALTLAITLLAPALTSAAMESDPLLYKVTIDQFEIRDADGADPLVLDAEAWIGTDLNKLWITAEVEHHDGETEEAEVQLLYGRAIAAYWDLRAGWRRDERPRPRRDWLVLGIEGLAPYWFETEASLFVGEQGRVAARLGVEQEWLLTRRWILSPELEANLHSENDAATGAGAGLSDLALGLRLRYEVRREFAPYVGVHWQRSFGRTADFTRDSGEDTEDTQLVAGLRAWF